MRVIMWWLFAISVAAAELPVRASVRFEPALNYEQFGWRSFRMASHEDRVSFTICLVQRNVPTLKRRALQASTPGHADYGKFLTASEIASLTSPPPEAISAVKAWLNAYGIPATVVRESVHVSCSASLASALLRTSFAVYKNEQSKALLVRASRGFSLPDNVASHVATIFGLHGLPAPRLEKAPAVSVANVTPAVLWSTYSIGSPFVNREGKGRQAVAEFQGQFMDKADLATFFRAEVPNARPGDDQVRKFVGVPYKEGAGVEALLDVEFLMGVAPGVATEFWLWPERDFCADLHNFTGAMLAAAQPPLVSSISYGWQGNLSHLHCQPSDVEAVDINWAKLAAAGFSIMISSGDSGAGYSTPQCTAGSGDKGQAITSGTVLSSLDATVAECCEVSTTRRGTGWMWTPAKPEVGADADKKGVYTFDQAPFHNVLHSSDPNFPFYEVHILNGTLSAKGGSVALYDANGTFPNTTVAFGPAHVSSNELLRDIAMRIGGKHGEKITGRAVFSPTKPPQCMELLWDSPRAGYAGVMYNGRSPPPPPPRGNCTIYSKITGTGPASSHQIVSSSGPPKAELYPSWPASSPWVTAVGATRFVGQMVGGEEMATDAFGSGGGFSLDFDQTDATWQVEAVAKYVAMGDSLPKFPNATDFSPHGRATPDVSTLGEGFQVYKDGKVTTVGGTSASSPTFAAMISLLNEARLKAGKPQMGFLNPFLYANPDAFFDVVKGTNAYGRGPFTTPVGFACAPGWDAATGLGTPHFDKLLKAAMAAANGSIVKGEEA